MQSSMNRDTELMRNLRIQFADPSWLTGVGLKDRRWALWVALAVLLSVYIFDWGFSTERAVQCLIDESVPAGRWVDTFAAWGWMSVVTIVVSLVVLAVAVRRFPFQLTRSKPGWREVAFVGIAWATPLLMTRILAIFLPDSACPGSSSGPERWWSLSQLGGPAEEIWFAAAVAVWMLLWADRPRVKILGVLVGGGVLRGIFHVYQGWESVGLFVWGAVAALAVALTGRWVILFLLHYLNNALITAGGLDSLTVALVAMLVCFVPLTFASEKKTQKAPSGKPGTSRRSRGR